MVGLLDNVEREALNPVDEFAAFARLIDAGRSVEDMAAAIGVMPQVVKPWQRLREWNCSADHFAGFGRGARSNRTATKR